MGSSFTKEEFVSLLFQEAQRNGIMPDISIDESVMKYSGLNSTAVLEGYTSQLQSDLVAKVPGFVDRLGSSIAAFKGVPNAVGLGALIISFILEIAIKSVASKSDGSTLNMLRRVFAEEKASSVRDSMEECLKRLSMFMWEPQKALEETERLEKHLSDQLTRLKNSMLHDNQMSSRAMKHWVNGAAFHSQMLIHVARLEVAEGISSQEADLKIHTTRIAHVIDIYLKDLQDLVVKYKSFKHSTISVNFHRKCINKGHSAFCDAFCVVYDNELGLESVSTDYNVKDSWYSYWNCNYSLDAYINHMFMEWRQTEELSRYFLQLKDNVRKLILQNQAFGV